MIEYELTVASAVSELWPSALARNEPGVLSKDDPFAFGGIPARLRLNLLVGGDDESPCPMPQRGPVESAVVGSGRIAG